MNYCNIMGPLVHRSGKVIWHMAVSYVLPSNNLLFHKKKCSGDFYGPEIPKKTWFNCTSYHTVEYDRPMGKPGSKSKFQMRH